MKKLLSTLFALAFAFNVYAANIKISELPVVTSVTPATDVVPVVASGATSFLKLWDLSEAGEMDYITEADIADNAYFYISGHYRT